MSVGTTRRGGWRIWIAAAAVAALFHGGPAGAQVNVDSFGASSLGAGEDTAGEAANRVEEALSAGAGGRPAERIVPTSDELAFLDEDGRRALADSLAAYYRYRETGFLHRRAVFDWQLLSSKVIFVAVILLVAVGVYFSWLQFMAAARAPQAPLPAPPPDGAGGEPAAEETGARAGLFTTLEASASGIRVSSPVLGVVILVISLAFFYLYLVHVYPVHEVF